MGINPIKLYGNWNDGYALDLHVIHSEPIGEDMYGHMQFRTERSEIGELLYHYKYKNRHDNLFKVMKLVRPFLDSWTSISNAEVVIPVPASKKNRLYQPVFEIAQEIASYLKIYYVDDVLEKIADAESKNMDRSHKEMVGNIILRKTANRAYNLLLVDDLYSTGTTLQECVNVLRSDKYVKEIYVLTMTKTRNG